MDNKDKNPSNPLDEYLSQYSIKTKLLLSLLIGLVFITISVAFLVPFKDKLLGNLYPKPSSHAAAPIKKNFKTPENFIKHKDPEIKEGEVLIKLKPTVQLKTKGGIGAQAVDLQTKPVTFSALDEKTTPSALKTLNQQVGIDKVEKVIKQNKSFKSSTKSLTLSVPAQQNQESLSRIYKLSLKKGAKTVQALAQLNQSKDIEYAQPNYIYKINTASDDPYYLDHYPDNVGNRPSLASWNPWNPTYDYQWNLKKINAEAGWNIASSSARVVVAVVDTGVDYTHPDLGGCSINQIRNNECEKIVPGYNFVNDTDDPRDDNGHGTHVAGIIAASTNNGIGIAGIGVPSSNIKLMPMKVLGQNGDGDTQSISAAIVQAADSGAKVINMSFGNPTPYSPESNVEKEALDYAASLGVVLVAAAGNSGGNVTNGYWPANHPAVISVAATDELDQRPSYSNYGKVSVAAPGGRNANLLSLNAKNPANPSAYLSLGGWPLGDGYLRLNGTSMASPHVAGLAALILYKNDSLSASEVRRIIEFGSDDLGTAGYDRYFGNGRINIQKALTGNLPPISEITKPVNNGYVGNVYGTTSGSTFASYQVELGEGLYPASWRSEGITLVNGGRQPVSNGLLATIDPGSYTRGVWTLRLTVNGNNGTSATSRVTVNVDPEIKSGWPQELLSGLYNVATEGESALIASDLNNDGKKEIVAGSLSGNVYVWTFDGQLLAGWPKQTAGNRGGNSFYVPAVGDLDGDRNKEIAIQAYYENIDLSTYDDVYENRLHLFKIDGSEYNPSWPREGPRTRNFSNPIIEQLSSNIPAELYFVFDYKLYKFNGNGLNQDLITFPSEVSPAFISSGDINNDGQKEFVFTGYDTVYVYKADGVLLWSKNIDSPETEQTDISNAKATLADINNDGKLEVIVPTSPIWGDLDTCKVWVFKADGSNLPGWPQSQYNDQGNCQRSSVAVGDIDKDGGVELFWGTYRGRVLVFNNSGSIKNLLFGASEESNFNRGVSLADINNDGYLDILAGSSTKRTSTDGGFFAWDYQGNLLPGWPKNIMVSSVPQVSDIEGDGKADIIVLGKESDYSRFKIFIFNTNSNISTQNNNWPMHGFNEGRTSAWKSPQELFAPPQIPQTFNLSAGLNAVGLTVNTGDLIADLNSGGAVVTQVLKYNNTSRAWDTTNFDITPGVGYFIKSSSNVTKTISGSAINLSSLSLSPGWNLISFPSVPSTINKADSLALELQRQGVSVSSISRWINGAWQTHIVNFPVNKFDILPGVGYFVNLTVGGEFVIPSVSSSSVSAQAIPAKATLPCTTYTTDIDKNSRVTGNDLNRFVACNNKRLTDKDKKGNLCKASDTNADLRIDKADYDCIRANIGKSYKLIKATKSAGPIPALPR